MSNLQQEFSVNSLRPHQEELYHLAELAGIHMNHKVFRILVEFLNMGVDPGTIHRLLLRVQQFSKHVSRRRKT